jgi:predicted ATPase
VMGSSIATSRVMGLVTFRPEFHHEFGNRSYYTQIHLNPLDAHEARQMLQCQLGHHAALRELENFVVVKSEGNPFFIEEMLQALFDQGVLVRGDTARIARPLAAVTIPATVQGILASRIDRLPAEQKDLLQAMAVIGRKSPLGLLRRVVAMPDRQLEHLLADLQFLEFVYEQPTALEPEYVLKHALTQDVAYNSLLREQRAALHERAAQAIETLCAGCLDERLDELAHHYGRSANSAKAVQYLHLAGRQALARSAVANAISHLNRALALLDAMGDNGERAQQELELRLLLGPALMASEGYGSPEVEQVYSRARELCRMVGETPQLCAVLYGLFSFYSARARYETANELALQMVRLADNLNDPVLIILASFALGQTQFLLGEPGRCRDHFERTATSYSRECQRELALVGYPDRALSRVEEAAALARESGHLHSLTYALFFRAWLCHFRREWRAALDGAQAVLALAADHGLPLWTFWATSLEGSAMVEQGQTGEGRERLARGLGAVRAAGAHITMTQTLGLVAQAHARSADPHQGLATVDEALAAAENSGECYYVAELHRLRGELLLIADASNDDQAERCFRTSIDVARRQGARSWELRGATSLARLLAQQDKRHEARAMLAEIHGWFTEGFDTADLKEAQALLGELGA